VLKVAKWCAEQKKVTAGREAVAKLSKLTIFSNMLSREAGRTVLPTTRIRVIKMMVKNYLVMEIMIDANVNK